jgi:predicted lipid-binding transport protein (Tim44 family)
MMGGLGGLLLGGLIGSMLFGGFGGGGLFGGIGLVEILLIGGGIFLLMSYLRRRQPQPALAGGYGAAPSRPSAQYSVITEEASPAHSDLEQGIRYIRQMDPNFDPLRFQEIATDLFFKIQAGWGHRDVTAIRSLLAEEMFDVLQRDANRLKAERKINRLENIAVRSSEVTEAWQEAGRDFVTIRFIANLLDYTVDETSGALFDGSKDEPVKFEEYWTFTRSVGDREWKLTAIQQP